MKIGFITPWDVPHGIAAYSRNLVLGLRGAVEPHVVGFELDEAGQANVELELALYHVRNCDLIHIQFDKALYGRPLLEGLLQALRERGQKVVITAHNLDIWLGFPHYLVDCWIMHHLMEQTYQIEGMKVIPMGVQFCSNGVDPLSTRSVCCFGAKSEPRQVEEALDKIGGGILSVVGPDWLPQDELMAKLQRNQVIVMNYPEGDSKQASKAAMLALGSNRPLIVSDVPEFSHVENFPGVAKATDATRLAICLEYTFSNYPQAMKFSEDRHRFSAQKRLTFDDFLKAHTNLYSEILDNPS